MPRRVHVNLNAITEDGLIRVRESRADGPVERGQLVEIYEPTDEIEGIARVVRINPRTHLMYLDVNWESIHDLTGILEPHTAVVGFQPAPRRSHLTLLEPAFAVR